MRKRPTVIPSGSFLNTTWTISTTWSWNSRLPHLVVRYTLLITSYWSIPVFHFYCPSWLETTGMLQNDHATSWGPIRQKKGWSDEKAIRNMRFNCRHWRNSSIWFGWQRMLEKHRGITTFVWYFRKLQRMQKTGIIPNGANGIQHCFCLREKRR